jgi:hypothetical protein
MVQKVLNPRTNRLVSVGGPVWRRLVRENLIANNSFDTTEVLGIAPPDIYERELVREELRDTLEEGYVPKLGSGHYKGKFIKSRSPNHPNLILKKAKQGVKDFAREHYEEASDDSGLDSEIDELFQNLALNSVKDRLVHNEKINSKGKYRIKKPEPIVEEEDEGESEGDESEDEGDNE